MVYPKIKESAVANIVAQLRKRLKAYKPFDLARLTGYDEAYFRHIANGRMKPTKPFVERLVKKNIIKLPAGNIYVDRK